MKTAQKTTRDLTMWLCLGLTSLSCSADRPRPDTRLPTPTPISAPVRLDGGAAEASPDTLAASACAAPEAVAACREGWCKIPAGCFRMGSPVMEDDCRDLDEHRHPVTLTRAFSILEREVTQARFQQVMGYNPSAATACGGECPVESLSWHEAAAFANALSSAEALPLCYACTGSAREVRCEEPPGAKDAAIYACGGYRLPTEAEWEYAYRAGSGDHLYSGSLETCFNADANADKIGWYRQNAKGAPHPVGGKLPNAWGLLDMAGNVGEWVHDGYGLYPQGAVTDPTLRLKSFRSYRGGSFFVYAKNLRGADRNVLAGEQIDAAVGFRVVRTEP